METSRLAERPVLVLRRHYPVAPEKVWRAWTDAQALSSWFRPDGFTVLAAEAEPRAGGRFHILMKAPDGTEYDLTGTYKEVAANRRLVMTWSWRDQPGETSLLTVTLRPDGRGTALELRHEGFLDRGPEVQTHEEGWTEALEQLGGVLARESPFLQLDRHYPAAPEKVWRAWTDPEAISKWFGPGVPHEPVSLAELDVRVGGRFRIVFGGAQGTDHEVQGVYKEVVPNRRLVFTWTWPNTTPERESVVTIVFKAKAGGTELVFRHERHVDDAVRDNHLRGWTGSFEKLERLLAAEDGE